MIWSNVVLRFVALAVLYGLFWAWDWMPIRVLLRDVIGWSIRVSGYAPASFVYYGSPALGVQSKVHHYSQECTYIDLLIIVLPFIWRFGDTLQNNIWRIGIATVVILGLNLVRCWAAVYLDVRGVGRFLAHDLPDYVVWWPTVVIVALLALQHDYGDRIQQPSTAIEAEFPMHVDETPVSMSED